MSDTTPKVTGIGGIFFRSEDPKALNEWYGKHLGMPVSPYGTIFESRSADNPEETTQLVWTPFKQSTDYFDPSKKEFMINYRVQHLEQLITNLREQGVTVIGEIQNHEYGKFAHIMDIEGNKIELWEPAAE